MKTLCLNILLFASFSASAQADVVLRAGEVRNVGRERVYCAPGGSQPTPAETIYECKCVIGGINRWVGNVRFSARNGNVGARGTELCQLKALNDTQRLMMEAGACRPLNIQ